MKIQYEVISEDRAELVKDLCNNLMAYQKLKSSIHTELFDNMSFETRMLPSLNKATENYIRIAKVGGKVVGYVYANISPKTVYDSDFATFFNMDTVHHDDVGSLSQFYIMDDYRGMGIGSHLFSSAMDWIQSFEDIEDIFIYVSNGNDDGLRFYESKGFKVSHQILDGFITVLRNS